MVEAASIQTMLECMGFTPEAARLVTGDQGIDSVDELRNLDDDKASNLCRVLRRPGGTNAAGAADPGTAEVCYRRSLADPGDPVGPVPGVCSRMVAGGGLGRCANGLARCRGVG